MKRTYVAAKGTRLGKRKAQIYGQCLEEIERKNGCISPRAVVNRAREKSSPLHSYFDWNDTRAAEKYRLVQARGLINHLTVVINYDTGAVQKAFFNVSSGFKENKSFAYVNIERALTNKEYRRQVLQNAMAEILYWKTKYQEYSEFKGIVGAINKAEKRFGRKKK